MIAIAQIQAQVLIFFGGFGILLALLLLTLQIRWMLKRSPIRFDEISQPLENLQAREQEDSLKQASESDDTLLLTDQVSAAYTTEILDDKTDVREWMQQR